MIPTSTMASARGVHWHRAPTHCEENARNCIEQERNDVDVEPMGTPPGKTVGADDWNQRQASGAEEPSQNFDSSRIEAQQGSVDREK